MKEMQTQPYKPRVVFPFVEAGMGHIMPMQSLANAFEKKYGQYCEVVRTRFFQDSGEKPLLHFEKNLVTEATRYAKNQAYGYINMFSALCCLVIFKPQCMGRHTKVCHPGKCFIGI